ncbi:signal peptidase I [Streptomyces sp. JJ38]|uniref:signal peptidase I n=1 Tax=Streptomyces sp. JJ38 TaxID=2738128 RepID=UPI001C58AA22|nr:signal peptidase I [Streptomyces sp. JJ38]MBW1598184.1 signal peptidase I [Streptomyces sp. JJ38]
MGKRGRPRSAAPAPARGARTTDTGPGVAEVRSPAGARGPAGAPTSAGQEPAEPAAPVAEEAPVRGEGRAARRKAARRLRRRRRLSATKEIPILLGVAVLIALLLKTFLVQAFVIPSGSMEQTIRIDDRVLVDKLTPWFGSEPERGDVVVFEDPGGWLEDQQQPEPQDDPVGIAQAKSFLTFIGLLPSDDEQDLIKRVIAVGGDRVVCCDEDGRVTVNGTPLNEPYLHPGNRPSEIPFDVTVPEDRLFVMGDHRSNSADSRFHLEDPGEGTIPTDLVVGRAVVIAWPLSHWTGLGEPETYASVPDPSGRAPTASAGPRDGKAQEFTPIPMPGELALVIGVAGLRRWTGGRWHSVRRERGERGGRPPGRVRWRRSGGPARGGARRTSRGGRLVGRRHGRCSRRVRWLRRRGR